MKIKNKTPVMSYRQYRRARKALEQEIENEAGQIADVGRFLQLADKYSDLQEPLAATEKPA